MSDNKYTIQEIIGNEVLAMLKPLRDAANDPFKLMILLRAAGIDENFMKDIPPLIAKVKTLLDELLNKATALQTLVNNNDKKPLPTAIYILELDKALYEIVKVLRKLRKMADDNALALPAYIKDELKRVAIADLIDMLLIYHLEDNRPTLFKILVLLRIVKPVDLTKEITITNSPSQPDPAPTQKIKVEPGQSGNAVRRSKHDRFTFDWDALGNLVVNPRQYLLDAYRIKGPASGVFLEGDLNQIKDRLFPPLAHFFNSIGLYSFYGTPLASPSSEVEKNLERTLTAMTRTPLVQDVKGFSMSIMPSTTDGFEIWFHLIGVGINENKTIEYENHTLNYTLAVNDIIAISKSKIVKLGSGGVSVLKASLEFKRNEGAGSGMFIGNPESTFLYLPYYKINGFLEADPSKNDIGASIEVKDAIFVLKPFKGDGLLAKIIPEDGVYGTANIELGLSKYRGLYLNGSGAMVTEIQINRKFFGIDVESLYIALILKDGKIDWITAVSFSVTLSMFNLKLKRIGIKSKFRLPRRGFGLDKDDDKEDNNRGGFDIDFKWPEGIGISLDWPKLRGKGFIEFDKINGKYVGLIDIKLFDKITVKAIASLITKMPDGSKGYSLVVIIVSEGFKPIPLGLGFNLVAIGGILGKDRTMSLAALREGVRDGGIESIFLEGDIYKNASKVIANIDKFFPPSEGRYLIGPLGKINWGAKDLFTINLGVIIELPSPVRVAIPGVLKAIIPQKGNTVIDLQVNFIGFIDFGANFISFDASLYNSKMLHYALTGDMAFRLTWGKNPFFLITVGGFHPSYSPPPLGLPVLNRLGMTLSGDPKRNITLQAYFAITSNSVQFGAAVFAYFEVSRFVIRGYAIFDALFLFSPFSFTVHFQIGASISYEGREILRAEIQLKLSGPNPWKAEGSLLLEIKLLVFKAKLRVSFDLVFGDGLPDPIQVVAYGNILNTVIAQATWNADLNSLQKQLVNVIEDKLSEKLLIHPDGIIEFAQNVMPLNMVIDKFGNALPENFNKLSFGQFRLNNTTLNSGVTKSEDFFPLGEFKRLADHEKLDASRAFQLVDNGFKIGSSELTFAHFTRKAIEFEVETIDNKLNLGLTGTIPLPFDGAFDRLRASAIAQSPLSQTRRNARLDNPLNVVSNDYEFYVADANTLNNLAGGLMFRNITEAQQYLTNYIAANPSQSSSITIVNTHSIN